MYKITVHQDFITSRWWWVIVGKVNGLDGTYSEAKYKKANDARRAALRYIQRWTPATNP